MERSITSSGTACGLPACPAGTLKILTIGGWFCSYDSLQRKTHLDSSDFRRGIPVRAPGGWGRRRMPKPANEVITDLGAGSAASVLRTGGSYFHQRDP